MADVKVLVGTLISVVASIGIAYFTEKQATAGAALSGTMNVVPVFMNAPAGLLMPLEVVQSVVFHLMQSGRKNVDPSASWMQRVLKYDKFANFMIVLVLAAGIVAAWSAPASIRHEQLW